MLNILGLGFAYPETVLDNTALSEACPSLTPEEILVKSGIHSRRTVLPLSYIIETRNTDLAAAAKVLRETPTDLALKAAKMALDRAGIVPEQIGLIIGDGATPLETTPSEGQRLGESLRVKVPAYDIFTSSCAAVLHPHIISEWRESEVPDYVLCVSANTPTRCINYGQGEERLFFGDAAGAAVLSTRHRGKLALLDSAFHTEPAQCSMIGCGIHGHLSLREDAIFRIRDKTSEMLHRANVANKLDMGATRLVGTQITPLILRDIANKYLIDTEYTWLNADRMGYSLGASETCVLAEKWDEIQGGETIVVSSAGGGFSYGYLVLKGLS